MKRNIRRIIFWLFALFFICLSILVALFAQGWRLDFNTLKIVKTGGIYIETYQSDAKIYVNDKFIESTGGLLANHRLITELIPGNYNIFVYKEGYFPWNKTVEVKDGLVAEIANIFLFPLEPKKEKVAELPLQSVSEFSAKNETIELVNKPAKTVKTYDLAGKLLSSAKLAAATTTESVISPDGAKKLYVSGDAIRIDYLKDIEEEPVKKSGETDLIARHDAPLKLYDWFVDSEHVVWFTGNELTVAERDDRGGKRNTIKYYLNIASPLFFSSGDSELYFFEEAEGKLIFYRMNLGK